MSKFDHPEQLTQGGERQTSQQAIVTKFLAYLLTQKRVAHHTYSAYRHDIAQFISFLDSSQIILEQARREHVSEFIKELKSKGLAPRSLARKISSLKVLYTFLHDQFQWPHIVTDVCFPKLKKQLPRYLSESEIQQLFDVSIQDQSPSGRRNHVMLLLLYVTGMRVSELINLKINSIVLDANFIIITGKGDKQRMVPVSAEIIKILQDYINQTHVVFVSKTVSKNKSEFLFPSGYAGSLTPMTRQAFWQILKNLCSQTSIKRSVSPHQLRHSLATHMLKHGADLRSLQLLLGHETIATVQIYTHVDTTHLRKVYDKKHPRS